MSTRPGYAAEASRLPTGTAAGYGSAAGVFEMLRAPGLAILPALYAKEFGFSLTSISLALLWLRLLDAVMDPAVGYLSDRTRSRWGRRKPWIFASIFVMVPGCILLYSPGDDPSMTQFIVAYFLYFLGWAMFDIPYTAWGAELAKTYQDRSRLSVARALFTNIGLMLTSLIPLLPFLPSTAMTIQVTSITAWTMAVLFPGVVLLALATVPTGDVDQAAPRSAFSARETWRAVRGNTPLLLFLGAITLSDLAAAVLGATAFLFLDSYLGIGESFTIVFLTAIGVSTLSLKAWQAVIGKTSKRAVLRWCLLLGIVHGGLVVFLEPGPLALPLFIGHMALYYILIVGRDVAAYAMIGDVVEYDTFRTGGNRAGQFTASWMVCRKLAYALGPTIGIFVAGVMGYDPAQKLNDATAVAGLKAAYGYIPAALMGAAAVFAVRYPLTQRRQATIQRRLSRRSGR